MRFGVFSDLLGALSDHAALPVTLPWAVERAPDAVLPDRAVYRWVEGTRLSDYSHSWVAWSRYTDTPDFATEFTAVVNSFNGDIDALADKVESFLLSSALSCGVITKQVIRPAANPNRINK